METSKSLYIRPVLSECLEQDLQIVYDEKVDKMIYTWCEGSKSYLPCIFCIPSYVVGYFKGKLGNKGFIKFKKDLINAVKKDYNLDLFNDENCNTDVILRAYGFPLNT
jgi:hypothetical protein